MRKQIKKKTIIELGLVFCVLGLMLVFMIPHFLRAQNINTERYFPDAVFRTVVELYMGVEPGEKFSQIDAAKKEGLFNISELASARNFRGRVLAIRNSSLNPVDYKIRSLKGLKYFPNITALNFSGHSVFQVDLSVVPKITHLSCSQNELTTLDVSMLPNLVELDCSNNFLRELDLSRSAELESIEIASNTLKKLDVRACTKLTRLICSHNNLQELDFRTTPKLTFVNAMSNELHTLKLPQEPEIERLILNYNQFDEFPLTHAWPSLMWLNLEKNNLDCDDLVDLEAWLEKQRKKQFTTPYRHSFSILYAHQNKFNLRNCGEE